MEKSVLDIPEAAIISSRVHPVLSRPSPPRILNDSWITR